MRSLILFFCAFAMAPLVLASPVLDYHPPQFVDGKIVIEVNDAGEAITMTEEEYYAFTGTKFTEHLVSFFNFKKSWEVVASYITETMEQEYDAFIIANVAPMKFFNGAHDIPSQHMKVIERTAPGQKLFVRNAAGKVVGIRKGIAGNSSSQVALEEPYNGVEGWTTGKGVMEELMGISSGAGGRAADPQPYVDTPTGIYRINHRRSDVRRYGKGMWHSLYFDLIYPSGRESGLAIHGTSTKKYKYLGVKQDSHGCIRVTKAQANVMYENFINNAADWWSNDLPDLNNRHRLKSENGKIKAGTRALMIIFYNYDTKAFDI